VTEGKLDDILSEWTRDATDNKPLSFPMIWMIPEPRDGLIRVTKSTSFSVRERRIIDSLQQLSFTSGISQIFHPCYRFVLPFDMLFPSRD